MTGQANPYCPQKLSMQHQAIWIADGTTNDPKAYHYRSDEEHQAQQPAPDTLGDVMVRDVHVIRVYSQDLSRRRPIGGVRSPNQTPLGEMSEELVNQIGAMPASSPHDVADLRDQIPRRSLHAQRKANEHGNESPAK